MTTVRDKLELKLQDFHEIASDFVHTSDMEVSKIKCNIDLKFSVQSARIRVGVENLMKKAFANLKDDLSGSNCPLNGMKEQVRHQLVDDHFLFMCGDLNLKGAGMERVWQEEDQLRIISMEKVDDVRGGFDRLACCIKAVRDSMKSESPKDEEALRKLHGIWLLRSRKTWKRTGWKRKIGKK